MGLGSYIIYLRALKEGITPREVAHELEMPEHYIHAIELEKHAGDNDSRGKLAEYFGVNLDDFSDFSRSTQAKFTDIVKKERRPQMGFLLMNGETLTGTVDGSDNSIIKIVEANTGVKTILQRHAIKKWWLLKSRYEKSDAPNGRPGANERRPMGGGNRPARPGSGGGSRHPGVNGGQRGNYDEGNRNPRPAAGPNSRPAAPRRSY